MYKYSLEPYGGIEIVRELNVLIRPGEISPKYTLLIYWKPA